MNPRSLGPLLVALSVAASCDSSESDAAGAIDAAADGPVDSGFGGARPDSSGRGGVTGSGGEDGCLMHNPTTPPEPCDSLPFAASTCAGTGKKPLGYSMCTGWTPGLLRSEVYDYLHWCLSTVPEAAPDACSPAHDTAAVACMTAATEHACRDDASADEPCARVRNLCTELPAELCLRVFSSLTTDGTLLWMRCFEQGMQAGGSCDATAAACTTIPRWQ